jgi:hypothetical protein
MSCGLFLTDSYTRVFDLRLCFGTKDPDWKISEVQPCTDRNGLNMAARLATTLPIWQTLRASSRSTCPTSGLLLQNGRLIPRVNTYVVCTFAVASACAQHHHALGCFFHAACCMFHATHVPCYPNSRVLCSAGRVLVGYVSAPWDNDGGLQSVPDYPDRIEAYVYGFWDEKAREAGYMFEHEPFLTTMEHVNDEPAKLHSMIHSSSNQTMDDEMRPPIQSIAWNAVQRKLLSVPDATKTSALVVPKSDSAMKGVFQRALDQLASGHSLPDAEWDRITQAGHAFVTSFDAGTKSLAFAPFSKLAAKAPATFHSHLDDVIGKSVHEWVASIKEKRSDMKKAAVPANKQVLQVQPGQKKRARSGDVDDFDGDELVSDGEGTNGVDIAKELQKSCKKLKQEVTAQMETARTTLTAEFVHKQSFANLEHRVLQMEQKIQALGTQQAVTTTSDKDIDASFLSVMCQVGTLLNVLIANEKTSGTSTEAISSVMINGIISSIDHVFKWNRAQKMAFYTAMQSISAFSTRLQELKKDAAAEPTTP